jgi:hypothetical protein
LVGAPLASVVDAFGECARRAGDGGVGLLLALGARAAEGAADDGWRVGVLTPGIGEATEGGAKVLGGPFGRKAGTAGRLSSSISRPD